MMVVADSGYAESSPSAFVHGALVFVLAGVIALGGYYILRLPVFDIQTLYLGTISRHYNVETLRANLQPLLQGSVLAVDLAGIRTAAEHLTWIRRAGVRRQFPDRLLLELHEHQPVAYWGTDGEQGLLNGHGEVFYANAGEIGGKEGEPPLPRLYGPAGNEAAVLQMYRALHPLFDARGLVLERLELNARNRWKGSMAPSISLELGGGTPGEIRARIERFLDTVHEATAQHQRSYNSLQSVDLRYRDGYAFRLLGVKVLSGEPLDTEASVAAGTRHTGGRDGE
ncbi:cell division protein FtsQ/DivIB [Candidatus Symbiobacter mobilis]|uniref:Cell division protein FtsQ n=1 Tax=Candidatus Symbiobacter mobilis CR TaxID=946483 RepID=U5N6I6_9BURK|nr:cell division protein FtsQ/DivIB [Candidatus Symbiobacter mobilis]AGX86987.1 cell division protein FtsQ [Candidatus Symbiobacter mobilis CR]